MENGKNLIVLACIFAVGILVLLWARKYWLKKLSDQTPVSEPEDALILVKS